jgi:hypothetical protein
MSEQDHKISSMLGLISTMAEELQFFRSKLSRPVNNVSPTDIAQFSPQFLGGKHEALIEVSDDDYEEEEEDEEEDEDDESDESYTDDDETDDGDDEEEKTGDIKILNLSLANSDIDYIENIEDIKDDNNGIINIDNNDNDNDNEVKTIHLEETQINDDMGFLKNITSIDMSDLEEIKNDYKKLPLNKLREVVVTKGLTTDASKLKKNDILKLLGEE